jgi:hypothetical protein
MDNKCCLVTVSFLFYIIDCKEWGCLTPPENVYVLGCDSEGEWFDSDSESDYRLKPHLSLDLNVMKKIYSSIHKA